jgi:outer membrane protein OmpA-like peptidoglycan-associated protein
MDMPNVQFAFDKYELKPDARIKLARVSGILLAYPDLKVQVEGYTDNVGSPDYNQRLSEQRADSVRGFLLAQSVQPGNVTAKGYGETHPVADNSTDSGRAENRRVELVISGSSIGVPADGPDSREQMPTGQTAQPRQQPPATGAETPNPQ